MPERSATNRKRKNILEMSRQEAFDFFLKKDSYCNFDMPQYFAFGALLIDINNRWLSKQDLSSLISVNGNGERVRISTFEKVNYTILNNKDGKYSWRPLQLIHPVLYVSLAQALTQKSAWGLIKNRFKEFSGNEKIDCMGLPVQSLTEQKDRTEQVSGWWRDIEQRSIELALDYEYVLHTDIADCYSSIYTHSIAWALHGKPEAKNKRFEKDLLGNIIDSHIRDMCHGQTNGLPQGSVLMDFIAEVVLGYADSELTKKIGDIDDIDDYRILRYRDDYRVFVHNPQTGELILKLLTEVLIELGLKLNSAKTKLSNRVVQSSIKDDKLFWIQQKNTDKNFQNNLLIVYNLAMLYPNSGSLIKALNGYYYEIENTNFNNEEAVPLISIIVDIAMHNPRSYAISAAILSKFIEKFSKKEKLEIFGKIKKRFSLIPNITYLELWLQRIIVGIDRAYSFESPICKFVSGDDRVKIWESEWLKDDVKKIIDVAKIISDDVIEKQPCVISKEEVELFMEINRYY